MRVRIVVADQSEACFYDAETVHGPVHPAGRIVDPQGHLRERDLVTDRPGRMSDRVSPVTGRRGAASHHGTDGDRSARKHEALSFARRVIAELEGARRQSQFDRLVLMAAPAFLGLLREVLPDSLRAVLAVEVDKNLVREVPSAVMGHVPVEVFWRDQRPPPSGAT